jgi:hypothetical protein
LESLDVGFNFRLLIWFGVKRLRGAFFSGCFWVFGALEAWPLLEEPFEFDQTTASELADRFELPRCDSFAWLELELEPAGLFDEADETEEKEPEEEDASEAYCWDELL